MPFALGFLFGYSFLIRNKLSIIGFQRNNHLNKCAHTNAHVQTSTQPTDKDEIVFFLHSSTLVIKVGRGRKNDLVADGKYFTHNIPL